ncbi:Rho GTPase activation protein [Lactarius quietus]|nr:Rho GTPase activation protein [Lactarius quietus]
MGSNQEVLTLRHRFESEGAISFSPVDNIHSVGILLMLYLRELPEPLFVLPLQDCRKYAQNRIKYPEDSFSLLQKKIRELHPVQKASLGALLQHLLRVASHSDTNSMTVEALIWKFCDIVLGANAVQRSNVFVKKAVLRDLIQNANTLFDEHLPHVPPPNVAEIT